MRRIGLTQTLWVLLGCGAMVLAGLAFAFSGGLPNGNRPAKGTERTVMATIEVAVPTVEQVSVALEENRREIVRLGNRYLAACAVDDLKAGYEMHSSDYRGRVSFADYSQRAKAVNDLVFDEDMRSEVTPFVRRFEDQEKKPLTIDPKKIVFMEQSTSTAHTAYEGQFGTEAFFDLDASFVKEAGIWRIGESKMVVVSGA
ncbi:MAG: hypothetical protein WCJ13_03925 [Coriobacteriia bacterium]